MTLSKGEFYALLIVLCLVGYIWLYIGITSDLVENKSVEVCLFKSVTNIPCPSCGSTRSVISIINVKFMNALYINPLGYIIAGIMILSPFWILSDVVLKKQTLFDFYKKVEFYLKKPKIAIPLILLILVNWIWNILKGL